MSFPAERKMAMIEKTCIICGKPFMADRNSKKMCSIACRSEYNSRYQKRTREKHKEEEYRECEICGKKFVVRSNNHKVCSRECSSKRNYECQKKRREHTAICRMCGKEFVPTQHLKLFCSEECSGKTKVVSIGAEVKCKISGKPFIKSKPCEVYCGEECRYESKKNAWRKYHRKITMGMKEEHKEEAKINPGKKKPEHELLQAEFDLARSMGISYGQLQANRWMEKYGYHGRKVVQV